MRAEYFTSVAHFPRGVDRLLRANDDRRGRFWGPRNERIPLVATQQEPLCDSSTICVHVFTSLHDKPLKFPIHLFMWPWVVKIVKYKCHNVVRFMLCWFEYAPQSCLFEAPLCTTFTTEAEIASNPKLRNIPFASGELSIEFSVENSQFLGDKIQNGICFIKGGRQSVPLFHSIQFKLIP